MNQDETRMVLEKINIIESLRDEVRSLRDQVAMLYAAVTMEGTKTMRAKDIEEMYGLAKNSTYSYNRLYLPNFGYAEGFGTRKMSWTKQEVLEWNQIPIVQREARRKQIR